MAVNRLGDIIDDYCTRCHLLTNHSTVAMVGEDVKKVRCRTCQHEHDYRHCKGGQKKRSKLSAYEEVLASVLAGKATGPSLKPAESVTPTQAPARGRIRPLSRRPRPLTHR